MTQESLSSRTRRTIPMLPFPDQRALHLHEGEGRQLSAGKDDEELSFVPGQFGVRQGERGFRGFRGERGNEGAAGLDAPPSAKDGDLTKPPALQPAKSNFDIEGLLRFQPDTTLLQRLVPPLSWSTATFETSDPGGGQIWLSAT